MMTIGNTTALLRLNMSQMDCDKIRSIWKNSLEFNGNKIISDSSSLLQDFPIAFIDNLS